MNTFPDKVIEALMSPLPGRASHERMIGINRPRTDVKRQESPKPKESSVLMLLYPRERSWHTVFILRPDYDGVHAKQVGFPGGKVEAQDRDIIHTALRETEEEVGIEQNQIEVLGLLSELYIPPSNIIVQPVLGKIDFLPTFIPDSREVELLIETPVQRILDSSVLQKKDIFIDRIQKQLNVTYFDIQGHVIWGATALILNEFRELMLENGVHKEMTHF